MYYAFLSNVIYIQNNQVIDLSNGEVVGGFRASSLDGKSGLIKFQTSSYRIEDNNIYTITPSGLKMKIGEKIN